MGEPSFEWNKREEKHFMLGNWYNKEFHPVENFYELPRVFQRGAERLRRKKLNLPWTIREAGIV